MKTRTTKMIAIAALPAAALAMAIPGAASAALTKAEQDTLVSLRVEEKLAHDTYATLAARTGLGVFSRIVRSESQHSRILESQLAANGITDPTDGMKVGVFPDAKTTALYRSLVARGSKSTADAYAVGRTIERLDIRDLTSARAGTSDATLTTVYTQLIRASNNHLRAFSATNAQNPHTVTVGGWRGGRGAG